MPIPNDYKTFDNFEEQLKKYKEWDFKNRKQNELKTLYYKGIRINNNTEEDKAEECIIIGYNDDILLIELKNTKEKITIDRRYLKQMQSKNFVRNQFEDDVKTKNTSKIETQSETEQLSLFSV